MIGTATIPSPADAAHRSCFGTAAGTTRPDVRLRVELDTNTSSVYQYQSSRLCRRFRGNSASRGAKACRACQGELLLKRIESELSFQVPFAASSPDEESSSSSEDAGSAPNGPSLPNNHHPRSASASVPDIRRPSVPTAKLLEPTKSRHHQRTPSSGLNPSHNNHQSVPPRPSSIGDQPPHTAKESFLNYFFGGPNGTNPPPNSSLTQGSSESRTERGQRRQQPSPSSYAPRDLLPDLGSGRRTASRSGLDNGTTAFDMKSLGKHIEAVGLDDLEEAEV